MVKQTNTHTKNRKNNNKQRWKQVKANKSNERKKLKAIKQELLHQQQIRAESACVVVAEANNQKYFLQLREWTWCSVG